VRFTKPEKIRREVRRVSSTAPSVVQPWLTGVAPFAIKAGVRIGVAQNRLSVFVVLPADFTEALIRPGVGELSRQTGLIEVIAGKKIIEVAEFSSGRLPPSKDAPVRKDPPYASNSVSRIIMFHSWS